MSVDVHRTPEERFTALPDFPYEPRYREWEGLRLAHLDEGPADGPVALLVHGEPTWSFLWRTTIATLVDAGFRCVAPDLPGFGRSDKPTDVGWYSYDRLVASLVDLVDGLDLRDATLVCHDWGGPVGLRTAALERPERFARLVAMDTGVFDGNQKMSPAWHSFRDFVEQATELPIGFLVNGGCATDLAPAVVDAYEAPFDVPAATAGARALPLLIPRAPDDPGAAAGAATQQALRADRRPQLILWGAQDPVLPADPLARLIGERLLTRAGEPQLIDGGHFLPEDAGAEIGERVAAWVAAG
ncbi:alpha/beta hydrolase [Patulibacter medicamentivorans]|uniref:Alpha/beta hydrolase n=1 Tax=Patulibacter medicamentivorans TaxID=1097667 RepID=H0E5G3_9ACTN|nr:haloalkane dehalogenase [Patulibacter medicamentivorans]EHN11084.1 alpha/beta hydrolase [Patulibacter medicamentivorans]